MKARGRTQARRPREPKRGPGPGPWVARKWSPDLHLQHVGRDEGPPPLVNTSSICKGHRPAGAGQGEGAKVERGLVMCSGTCNYVHQLKYHGGDCCPGRPCVLCPYLRALCLIAQNRPDYQLERTVRERLQHKHNGKCDQIFFPLPVFII